jgi:hypothetical protein
MIAACRKKSRLVAQPAFGANVSLARFATVANTLPQSDFDLWDFK